MWHARYEGSIANVHVSPHCNPHLGALKFYVQQIMRFVLGVKFRDRRRMSLHSSMDCSQARSHSFVYTKRFAVPPPA